MGMLFFLGSIECEIRNDLHIAVGGLLRCRVQCQCRMNQRLRRLHHFSEAPSVISFTIAVSLLHMIRCSAPQKPFLKHPWINMLGYFFKLISVSSKLNLGAVSELGTRDLTRYAVAARTPPTGERFTNRPWPC